MSDKQEFITHSAEETQQAGESFAQTISGGVVALYGDLGFGKTTFVQGFAKGLGIEKRIISPTFIIMRTYALPKEKKFYHIDLYRMQTVEDLEGLGIQEILKDLNSIVLIEWPERLGELLPKERVEVKFEMLGENERRVSITRIDSNG